MTTPAEQYYADLTSGKIMPDSMQEQALLTLQALYEEIMQRQSLFWRYIKKTPSGLYLWGDVGAGKTYLMDLFFNVLPEKRKLRLHFHRFMQYVHHELKERQGQTSPLIAIARQLAAKTDILCLDEFLVMDITDAMILTGLLGALFGQGVCLVTTSNTPPQSLYENGLQRQRFLPAIDLILKHTQVIHLQSERDYRLQTLAREGVYFTPLNANSEKSLRRYIELYAHHDEIDQEPVLIESRWIETVCQAKDIIWFDFNVLCSVPRSQQDYLAIARNFAVVLLSNVPKIAPEDDDKITYLINLVDVFYDENIELIISAAVPVNELYMQGRKQQVFKRTLSRLQEMQSQAYLKKAKVRN